MSMRYLTFVVWENVPGVLSDRGNAFGCILGALAGEDAPLLPPGGRWADAGYVLGPKRSICWRILDAQYFGLAQRRRRVFVVGCPRNGSVPRTILFEFDGLRRDTPPSRQAAEDIAGTLEASLARSHGAGGTDPGACVDVCQSLTGSFGGGGPDDNKAQAGFYAVVPPQVEMAAAGYMLPCSQYGTVAASLTSEGADASPCADRGPTVLAVRTAQTSANGNGVAEEISHTLDRANGQAVIAFHGSQDPDVSRGIAHPVGSNHGMETCVCYAPEFVSQAISSKWGKGTSGPVGDEFHNLVSCLAFSQNLRDEVRLVGGDGQICGALAADDGIKQRTRMWLSPPESPCLAFTERGRKEGRTLEYLPEQAYCLMNPGSGGCTHSRQILTPQLQDVPYRGKPAADGPRYRAIGNSMAVNVMRWIGQRIQQWEAAHV